MSLPESFGRGDGGLQSFAGHEAGDALADEGIVYGVFPEPGVLRSGEKHGAHERHGICRPPNGIILEQFEFFVAKGKRKTMCQAARG